MKSLWGVEQPTRKEDASARAAKIGSFVIQNRVKKLRRRVFVEVGIGKIRRHIYDGIHARFAGLCELFLAGFSGSPGLCQLLFFFVSIKCHRNVLAPFLGPITRMGVADGATTGALVAHLVKSVNEFKVFATLIDLVAASQIALNFRDGCIIGSA